MSRRSVLSSLLLSASLLLGACSPGLQAQAPARADDTGVTPIVAPAPKLDRAKLRAALAARRAVNFERFLAYRENRVYPLNTFADGFQHVWVDELGNLCAAATLISGDWGRDVSARVALEDNFVALAGVKDGPLLDWVLTSGLTHHEIVAIQAPGFVYDPAPELAPAREAEIARLHALYVDVERQLRTLEDASLDDAVDELLARPELARALLDGVAAGPGRFAAPEPTPGSADSTSSLGFATPPPG